MSDTTKDLKNEIHKSLELLRTLRDEVRVTLHLAGMDAKARWNKLEPHLTEVERAARDATDASKAAISDAVSTLKAFRDSLR